MTKAAKYRRILGASTFCAALVLASASAPALSAELDMELLREAFDAADTTGDGRIDEAELATDTVAAFVSVDDNGDDRITADELAEAGGPDVGKVDTDQNKKLDINEVMRAKLKEFKAADKDGDGELTFEEVTEYERQR
jgi:Ca2+-binding EF-hand superfamily protein